MSNTPLSTDPYKGTRDFYPEDQAMQNYMFTIMRRVAERYGYEEYNASIIEDTALYKAKSGEEIVNEQTYSFVDRGDREVTIRPEMTPTVARMIAHKRKELSFPLRWFSIPNLMRYERPQRGRLREHWQLNVDIFGVDSESADVELMMVSHDILSEFGASDEDYEIRVGHRGLTNALLRDYLDLDEEQAQRMTKLIDRKNKMSREDFAAQAEDIIGDKISRCLELLDIKNLDELPEELQGTESYIALRNTLQSLIVRGVTNAHYDPTIMRGFDYYTGIVFEVFDTDPENNRALFGGGRYDDLVALFDVEKVTGAGFGVGDVTMRDFLETHALLPSSIPSKTDVYLCLFDSDVTPFADGLADYLRSAGIAVSIDYSYRKIGSQVKTADKQNIPYAICIGETEVDSDSFTIKELKTGDEHIASREEIVQYILEAKGQR